MTERRAPGYLIDVAMNYRFRMEFPEQAMGDELMVFDPETDRVHVLNSTSSRVWSLLRKGLEPEAIALELARESGLESAGEAAGHVGKALEIFLERGLLIAEAAET